jgi:hypothetical protein
MVELTCSNCERTESFPNTLTVVTDEINGWTLQVKSVENGLQITDSYCPECQT